MSVDERRRLHLYEAARERLGNEAADTLMELLPPMDPSELATKGDLAVLRAELRSEIAEALREQTNRILMFVLPTMLTSTLLAFAAARFGA